LSPLMLEGCGSPQEASLQKKEIVYKLDLVMLQEIMCSSKKYLEFLSFILKDWNFCIVDVVGLFGGLVIGRNDKFDTISTSVVNSGILMELLAKDLGKYIWLINAYGPYGDRWPFWDNLVYSSVLSGNNVLLGHELNPLNHREIWGEIARTDPIGHYFSHLYVTLHLVYVEPIKIVPTWRNHRRGREGIPNRLDRFLLEDSFLNDMIKIKSWVSSRGVSNHLPILLNLDREEWKPPSLMKFNHACLLEDNFRDLIVRS